MTGHTPHLKVIFLKKNKNKAHLKGGFLIFVVFIIKIKLCLVANIL